MCCVAVRCTAGSDDSGHSWQLATIQNNVANRQLGNSNGGNGGVSCTGSGSSAVCVAVGIDYHTQSPFCAVGSANLANWTVGTSPSGLTGGQFVDAGGGK